jgi:hypothetical protein
VVKRCLQGEEASLDVHGVRERVLRIGRVGHVVKDADEFSADLCARWLVGTYVHTFLGLFQLKGHTSSAQSQPASPMVTCC